MKSSLFTGMSGFLGVSIMGLIPTADQIGEIATLVTQIIIAVVTIISLIKKNNSKI